MVLAHGSGIDDLATMVITLVVIGVLWMLARRRPPTDGDGEG